ncbi:hypothetical protein BP00DRAFT_428580 [Aspergillus indologenus CBS 114.80]|uniref:Uncharacterized protein n=1 Tax=Aspergillus indologenus CBS 114.80 TaxID=1450541 RepID=A0A2V5IVW0_9EURO|nr:hypothetical protein BP00DRAFT_428580 [Aspergillus indologenus CBS 114.80]
MRGNSRVADKNQDKARTSPRNLDKLIWQPSFDGLLFPLVSLVSLMSEFGGVFGLIPGNVRRLSLGAGEEPLGP